MRSPLLKLDKYRGRKVGNTIEIYVDNARDPLIYDLTYMLKESNGRVYFEDNIYDISHSTILKVGNTTMAIVMHIKEEQHVG